MVANLRNPRPSPAGRAGGYEEYHPYGSTAWWAGDSGLVSKKRYRYTGMERDEETGLQCHGVRYYAPWLGRWASADPIGLGDGPNRFAYVHGNPVYGRDSTGLADEDETKRSQWLRQLEATGVETAFIKTAMSNQYYIENQSRSLTTGHGITALNVNLGRTTLIHESVHYFMLSTAGADMVVMAEAKHLYGTPLRESTTGKRAGLVTEDLAERAAQESMASYVAWQVDRQASAVERVRQSVSEYNAGEIDLEGFRASLDAFESMYAGEQTSFGAFQATGRSALLGDDKEVTLTTPPSAE